MSALHPTTQRRLQKITQIPSVWEGDRRPLSGIPENLNTDGDSKGECIIWLDGSEAMVRAMDVVSPEMGPEAMVRTLLRAMENPQNPAQPARPQKIVVRDREIQFFLRGALQNLDIVVEYAPELPVIDEFFRGFEELGNNRPPTLPPEYRDLLLEVAYDIWQEEPWEFLADHNIISIELNRWDVGTLHASVMGMLGREYGVLLYRSLRSLKRFRAAVLAEESMEELEKAFLSQDCWFLNFEAAHDGDSDQELELAHLPLSEIRPFFGSVHPYEGMRPFLDTEEALAIYAALKAFHRFIVTSRRELEANSATEITKRFRISLPQNSSIAKIISVTVATLPDLAVELLSMSEFPVANELGSSEHATVAIQDNMVPEDAFRSLEIAPWKWVEAIKNNKNKHYQSQETVIAGEGIPVVVIQTSRPKAKAMIEQIKSDGGLKAICFNPGEDPFLDISYDLGILQTNNGNLYLFGEFLDEDPEHIQARQQWEKRCQKTQGYCALIVAMGLTGASSGNPQLKDMLALFEAKALSPEDLGMGILQLMPQLDFEPD